MATRTIAIIPARGGSRGVPGKNLREIGGKPLLVRTIEAALGAKRVDRVVVSTESPRLAEVARAHGASVVERPDELASDTASSESALLHALEVLAAGGEEPELLVFLQCTSPLTTAADIDATIERLEATGADSALSAVPFHHFVWRSGTDGDASGVNHDRSRRPRRQDREPEYLEDGSVYVMRTEGFRRAKHRFFGKTVLRVAEDGRACEIDEPADLEVAEVLVRERSRGARAKLLPSPVRALVMDFDGVHTDDRVSVGGDGSERVVCNRSDGLGLERLRKAGLPMLVLSKERNPVVEARCRKLGIEHRQGVDDKLPALVAWLDERGLSRQDTVYVGNDVNDLACMAHVGCPVAVADARPEARRAARFVLARRGGRGALRELADMILEVNP